MLPLLLARFVLATVFAVAAFAKFADQAGTCEAIRAFGVPPLLVRPLAWSLVASEFAVAVTVLFPWSSAVGALDGIVLLTGMSAVVAVNLVRGRTPQCHCFGRLSTAPISWSTVARNALLATVAGEVATNGRIPLAFAGLAVVMTGLWLALGLVRSRKRRRGAPAPGFSLSDSAGATWTLPALLARRGPLLLVFSHPACAACGAFLPNLARWHRSLADRITIAVVSGGAHPDAIAEASSHGFGPILLDESGEVTRSYAITATPSAVLVSRDGRIASAIARGAEEIADLAADAIDTRTGHRVARRWVLAHIPLWMWALPLVAPACGTNARTADPRPADPSTTSPRPAKGPAQLRVGGAYLCDQRYALCTDAPCLPSTTDPNVVICDCVVKTGYSAGYKSCAERAPRGNTLYSDFSTALVTGQTRALSCPADSPWGNCLDVVCEVDPHDPSRARCQCQRVNSGPSFTFGGNCDTRSCSSTIWSAATPNMSVATQFQQGMKQLGRSAALPPPCPKR